MHNLYNDNYILFEPDPLVNIGIQALIDPENNKINHLSCLKDIILSLNENQQQTVIMELYHHSESIYQVIRFLLNVSKVWPKASIVVFTDITNPDILSLLTVKKNLSLVAKHESVHYLLAAILTARPTGNFRSPAMRQPLLQTQWSLSGSEWRVLGRMVAGADLNRVAQVIGCSYKTASSHKLNIMRKLRLNKMGFMQFVISLQSHYNGLPQSG